MKENVITDQILHQFTKEAPELQPFIDQVELRLVPTADPPFDYLLRSIIYQQLSGKAAATIYGRLTALMDDISPQEVLELTDDQLQGAGLSRQKRGYVRNVAEAFKRGGEFEKINSYSKVKKLSSDEITTKFTSIKGVGDWTVQMYLIFGLGRLDVFAAKDLGVRKGLEMMYDLDETPTPGEAKQLTKHWKSTPSVGTILCWRIQD